MKLVIPLHSLYWSIHTKDESKHLWCELALACGVTASFGVFCHEIKCNGMPSFMEFMCSIDGDLKCSSLYTQGNRLNVELTFSNCTEWKQIKCPLHKGSKTIYRLKLKQRKLNKFHCTNKTRPHSLYRKETKRSLLL